MKQKTNTLESYRKILSLFNEIEKEMDKTNDYFSEQEKESLAILKNSFHLGISNIIRLKKYENHTNNNN